VVGKHKAKKLHCPWTGPYKIAKRISGLVYRIQDTHNRKRQVVNFENLKPCPQQMRDKSQPDSGTQEDNQIQIAGEEDNTNTPPGTVLQLIDEYNDEEMDAPDIPQQSQRENDNSRRYPQCRNRRKPVRYQDGVP